MSGEPVGEEPWRTLGSTIPPGLNRFKVAPEMATGVFTTTSSDIFGVLICFLMATAIYLGDAGVT